MSYNSIILEELLNKTTIKKMKIPQDLLNEADLNLEITGFVYPNENRIRYGIINNNILIGFFTPRKEKSYNTWRIGAIYVKPEFQNKGFAAKAVDIFFKSHNPAPVPIGINNKPSQKMFEKIGFESDKIEYEHEDGWKYHIYRKKY